MPDRIIMPIAITRTGDTMDFQEEGGDPGTTAFTLLVCCHFEHPGPLCVYRSFKPRAHCCIHDIQRMGDALKKMFRKAVGLEHPRYRPGIQGMFTSHRFFRRGKAAERKRRSSPRPK